MFGSFSIGKHVVGCSQELDVAYLKACFLEDFARGGCSEGFAVLEVAAGTLEGSWGGFFCVGGGDEWVGGGKGGIGYLRHGCLLARP